jgi:hypothetical protein
VPRTLTHASYIAAEVPYKLRDSAREEFGVIAASGAHKPAFSAVASALASPFGPVSRTRLRLRLHSGAVLATGSGPVGDIMQLEASASNGLLYRASFTLDRFDRFSLALPRVVGSHGVRVRVWQLWAGRGAGALASI